MAVAEMEMKLAITYRETIKPSSPTPFRLRNFKLSLLDQFAHTTYAPLLLFFPGNDTTRITTTEDKSERLRKSLSETLTRFYPVAGRLNGDLTAVDCNDEGVCYSEARISCSLSDVLMDVRYDQIKRLFIPSRSGNWGSGAEAALLFAQVTFFECGGMAVVTLVSHRVADAATIYSLTKAWASATSGCPDAVVPDFSCSSLFPTKQTFTVGDLPEPVKFVTRRFVFDASKISALKLRVAVNMVQQPTRVQVVSALLWKCSVAAAAASRSKLGSKRPRQSLLTWTLNIRSKLVPPVSDYSFGNMVFFLLIKNVHNDDCDMGGFVCRLKEGFAEFNNKYVWKLREEENVETVIVNMFHGYGKEVNRAGRDVDSYFHTSLCRLGLYDVDFGWGKPTWATFVVGHDAPNVVVLTDTFDGKGVEAQVNLIEEEMDFFECDPELLEFASVNPSPLQQESKLHKLSVNADETLV